MLYLVIAGLQGSDLAELPTRLAHAQSDTEKEDAVVAITRSLGIGTYDPNGKPLYPGAERGCLDPYLYDFELRALAIGGNDQVWSLNQFADELNSYRLHRVGIRHTAESLRNAMVGAAKAAVADPSQQGARNILLVRNIGLGLGYDLAVAPDASEIKLNAVQRFLFLLDAVLPLIATNPLTEANPADFFHNAGNYEKHAKAIGPDPCGNAGKGVGGSWDVGLLFNQLMSDAEEEGRIYTLRFTTDLIHLIHRVVLQHRWVIKRVDSPGEMHYGHGETPQTQFFAVRIWGVLTPTFDFVTAGWLAGLEIPPPGPAKELPVDWSLGDLPAHGTIDCPENGCRATDAEGLAVLKFIPRQEREPSGAGSLFIWRGNVAISGAASSGNNLFAGRSVGSLRKGSQDI